MSADVAAVFTQASQANTNAAGASSNAISAATSANSANIAAQGAATAAQASYNESLAIHGLIGTPMSGTISADISSSYSATLNISASISGSGQVDLTPVMKVIGTPISTVSRDIYEVARLVKTKK